MHLIRKTLAFWLAFIMVFIGVASASAVDGTIQAPEATATLSFADCEPNAWYQSAVTTAATLGLVNGYQDGTFRPNQAVSLGECAAVLCRVSGRMPSQSEAAHGSNWAYAYISMLAEEGIIETKTINANQHVRRETAVSLFVRAAGSAGAAPALYPDVKRSITDLNKADSWYAEDITAAYLLGLIRGDKNGCFRPKDTLTRAELCQIAVQFTLSDKTVPEPEVARHISVVADTNDIPKEHCDQALAALQRIPEKLLDRFTSGGGVVRLTSVDLRTYLNDPPSSEVSGLFKQPDIFIRYKPGALNVTGTTMHEFGHYVHRTHPEYDAAIERLFLEEIDGVSALAKRTYCQTSEREFFAEAFKAYFAYPRESLLEMAPGTTQIIDDILTLYAEGSASC